MAKSDRSGIRKKREQMAKSRFTLLGYYFILTDTKETEQNYMNGLRDSIPVELQRRLIIKVKKTNTENLVDEAINQASLNPQYSAIWIIFDRDQVKDFDKIIEKAEAKGINVGWTNPCIEEWFCAYFGSMPTTSDSVACCNKFKQIFLRQTSQKYYKSDPDIYKKLNRFGDEKKAVVVAAQKMSENEKNDKIKPSEQIPGTTMHLLVDEIKSKFNI